MTYTMARDQRVVAEVHIGTNPQRFQPYPMAWKAWLHKYIVGTLQPLSPSIVYGF